MNGLPNRCPDKASCTTSVIRDPIATKIDEYVNLSFSDEKARLDQCAIELNKEPSALGYILAYAGRRARVGEPQWLGERAKRYLVKAGFDPGRVVAIDVGHRE